MTAVPEAKRVRDFGFDPDESPRHFVVLLDGSGAASVAERVGLAATDAGADSNAPGAVKALLDAYRWSRVAPVAADVFNRRLRQAGHRAARWRATETLLAPAFGKELTLLCWAVEDADPTLLPNIVANWAGLAPEERWWLYTTINATAGHPEHGRDRGWRKAIKIAFAENPAGAPPASLAEHLPPVKDETEQDAPQALPDPTDSHLESPPMADTMPPSKTPAPEGPPRRRAVPRQPRATQVALPLNGQ